MDKNNIFIRVHNEELRCPRCGSPEVVDNTLPVMQWTFNIRAFRVDDWSECLVCKKNGIRECWFNLEGKFGA